MLHRRLVQVALQAVLWLASEPEGTRRRVRDLAAGLGIPPAYMAQVIRHLTRVGLLRAVYGPGGGVELASPPSQLCPWDVLSALEPVREFERCFVGLGQCSDREPCPFHKVWDTARQEILDVLQNKTLEEIMAEFQQEAPGRTEGAPGRRPVSRLSSPGTS